LKTIWHIQKKSTGEHDYFGSLVALWRKYGAQIGVSKSKVEKGSRRKKQYIIETDFCIIRKGLMKSVSDVCSDCG
jgi:hypothetical protein